MRKYVFLTVTLFAVSMSMVLLFPNQSKAEYGMAGCGVGALIFEDKPGFVQLFAATTNDAFTQTSSITSGTSECHEAGIIKAEHEQRVYVTHNLENLETDIAKGAGESLNSLAYLMGCSKNAYGDFGKTVQAGYPNIFKKNDNKPEWVHYRIKKVLSKNKALVKSCTRAWL